MTTGALERWDDLYTLAGFPRDANGDGYPDRLRARIVLETEPDAELWCALFDLAARLGLETAGFSPPLVVTDVTPDVLPILARRGNAEVPRLRLKGQPAVIVEGAAAVRALARAGQAATGPLDGGVTEPLLSFDLRDLLESTGLLADHDGDAAPDGTRLCVVVPERLDHSVGAALIDFIARLGIESGGVDLPVATAGEPPEGAVPLRLRLDRSAHGAELSVDYEPMGPALVLEGQPDDAAALLERIALDWPAPVPGRLHAREAVDWLRRSLAGWTPDGRAAALLADLAGRPLPEASSLRLLSSDTAERQQLTEVARAVVGPSVPVTGPGSSLAVFTEEWSTRWEVDRALDLLRERVLPPLQRGEPLSLTLLVSEPAAVRARLAEGVRRLASQAGFTEAQVTVLDAFKAGLGWLTEVVLRAWSGLEGIERVVLRYRSLEPAEGEPAPLDMRIRWLQELFPADELLAAGLGLPLEAISLEEWSGEALYAAEALGAGGEAVARETFTPFTYARPYIGRSPEAGSVHVVSGGIIARQGEREMREPLPTDLDLFWDYFQGEVLPRVADSILAVTAGQPRVVDQPFFDELRVEVTVSETDEPFGLREEQRSAAESLHEDIYFNALDMIETLGTETSGERLGAPGPVLPFVHVRPGRAPTARVSLRARPRGVAYLESAEGRTVLGRTRASLPAPGAVERFSLRDKPRLRLTLELNGEEQARLAALADLLPAGDGPALQVRAGRDGDEFAVAWPEPVATPVVEPAESVVPEGQIINEERLGPQLERLAREAGVRYLRALDWSYAGRAVRALELTAPMTAAVWSPRKLSLFKPTLMVIARHHANEVASTTAALLLAEHLIRDPRWRWLLSRVNVVMLPFSNPDGAALHDLLQGEHPAWKHHPARYNAVGYEFGADVGNPDSPYGEARARDKLWFRWLPDIVVDNHGVPSHEWAQIFAGFGSPPRFGVSYWQVQALLYGILYYQEEHPEHRQAAYSLRDAVAQAVAADAELLAWNRTFRERYVTWGASRVPERFPSGAHREMIWHFGAASAQRARRGYAARFPQLTVANWVTEVSDETVRGAMLRRTARAHLIANRAQLDLLAAAATPPERRILSDADGSRARITLARRRPIRLG